VRSPPEAISDARTGALEPSQKELRMCEAAARRQALEEARKQALLAKQATKQARQGSAGLSPPGSAGSGMGSGLGDGALSMGEEIGADEGAHTLLAVSDADKRAMAARERRLRAEEEKKNALLQKRQAKAEKREAPDADHEVCQRAPTGAVVHVPPLHAHTADPCYTGASHRIASGGAAGRARG
jgi:hypothetical protein